MDAALKLFETALKVLGLWVFLAGAVACGVLLWSSVETARQYSFDIFRAEHGAWLVIGFWVCAVLSGVALLQSIARLGWGPLAELLYERRAHRNIRRKLERLSLDEKAILYALHTDHRKSFEANNNAIAVRKMENADLVEYSSNSVFGWTAYQVPNLVWEVSNEFMSEWGRTITSAGYDTPQKFRAFIQQILGRE